MLVFPVSRFFPAELFQIVAEIGGGFLVAEDEQLVSGR